jgi:hypothetical protein
LPNVGAQNHLRLPHSRELQEFRYVLRTRALRQWRRQRWPIQPTRQFGNQRSLRNFRRTSRALQLLQTRLNDLGRVRVTLGAASVRIRALFADSSIIGYSTRWVWSNEGDRTPTLERF